MQICVFTAPVCNPDLAGTAAALLSNADRLRMQSMRTGKRRLEFLGGRLLARQSLSACYGERSLSWEIETQANGALFLSGAQDAPAISLSHSKGRIACALGEASLLGVDIELVQARKHLAQLAEETLHTQELLNFSKLDAAGKLSFFYSKWVLKEALGKAMGCGINYPMRECLLDAGRLREAPPEWVAAPEAWAFSHALLDGGYHLGLAWQGEASIRISIKNVEIHL